MTLRVSRNPDLAEVIRAGSANAMFDLHTALPGKVDKYDVEEQKVDVKPLLKRTVVDSTGQEMTEELPVITDVPVVFPRAGAFFISFPIQVGDHVLLVFIERSIDRFAKGDGEDTDPVDLRMHDLSDAVALPGLYPFSKAISEADTDDMVFGSDEGLRVHFKAEAVHVGAKDASDKAVLDSKVQAELDSIKSTIDSLRDEFNNHTHPFPQFIAPLIPVAAMPTLPGGPPAPPTEKPVVPATASYSPGDTASEILFIDS